MTPSLNTFLEEKKKEFEENLEKLMDTVINKKFPAGEREWCVKCAKRIKKYICNLPLDVCDDEKPSTGEPNKQKTEWDSLKEKLADIEHQRWADWMKYLFGVCLFSQSGTLNGKGKAIIPEKYKKGWLRQMNTDYKDLTEKEKDSDREQVDRYLPLISQLLKTQREQLISEIEGIEELKDETLKGMNGPFGGLQDQMAIRNQLRKQIRERLKQLTNSQKEE